MNLRFFIPFCFLAITMCRVDGIGNRPTEESAFKVQKAEADILHEKVYRGGRSFIFEYIIVNHSDSLRINAPAAIRPGQDPRATWSFTSPANPTSIRFIKLAVVDEIFMEHQIRCDFQYSDINGLSSGFKSTSGIIETMDSTWLHPPRDKYFAILQLNPFPFIREPYTVGNCWTWNLNVGDSWQDPRWKSWQGVVSNSMVYQIIDYKIVKTTLGSLNCYVISAFATSSLGRTQLVAYFNMKVGFVKLDYTNIDGSKVLIDLIKIEQL